MDEMKACVIFNPRSGLSNKWFGVSPLEDIVAAFDSRGLSVTIMTTARAGHGTDLVQESVKSGYTHVLACGGDGTINEIVNGLEGSDVVLGIIPMGTENVLAKAMGVPQDVPGACEHFFNSAERPMDLGVVNNRNFIMMSGVGLDAQIVSEMDPAMKNALGSFGFLLKGAFNLLTDDGETVPVAKIRLIDKNQEFEYPAWMIIAGNIANYSGTVKLALNAEDDDGMLDIIVFPSIDSFETMKQLIGAFTETHLEDGSIPYFTSGDFEITTDPPLYCQADGELIGKTPARYWVKKGAIKVRF
ncbi:MAG: diacylglycerol kinase family lipid kinase [Firmicutes bacterium]|nr:diacylglycerol kinase family lipid kinase [Bacillota bacterium]